MKISGVTLPAGFRVLCSVCAQTLDAATQFSSGQLKKKHPRCRACAPNKFSNQGSGTHQSKKESTRARDLRALFQAGLIFELREQVRYELIPAQYDQAGKLLERPCHYIADFVYFDREHKLHVEDTKGFRTPEYIIKRKLMLWQKQIRIEEL